MYVSYDMYKKIVDSFKTSNSMNCVHIKILKKKYNYYFILHINNIKLLKCIPLIR